MRADVALVDLRVKTFAFYTAIEMCDALGKSLLDQISADFGGKRSSVRRAAHLCGVVVEYTCDISEARGNLLDFVAQSAFIRPFFGCTHIACNAADGDASVVFKFNRLSALVVLLLLCCWIVLVFLRLYRFYIM